MKKLFRVQRLDGNDWYSSSKWETLKEAQEDVERLKKDDPVFEYKVFVLVGKELIQIPEGLKYGQDRSIETQ